MATPKITFEAKIREQTVRMYADVPLKNAAGAIMNVLTQISQKVNLFNNKFVLCFGWSFYYLVERTDENGNKFWLIETDDYTTNPLKNRTDNATVSLITQNMQRECVQVAKVKPEGCTCKDTILVLKDAIEAEEVYMHRKSPAKDGDSGWYFGLLDDPKEEGKGRHLVIGDAGFLGRLGTVLTDKLFWLDAVGLEELAHGIEVLHRHDIVFRIVEEHHIEVFAGRPAAGKRILTEGGLELERHGIVGIEEGICEEIARLLGLDKLLVEGPALVLLAEEPVIEVLGHGILQIVVDVVTQTEEVVVGIEQVADGAGHLGFTFGDSVEHRVDVVGTVAGEGAFNLDFRVAL